jgi:hypothetical protein
MFDAQTTWLVNNQVTRNIVYTTHLGDIVNDVGTIAQWDIAGKLAATKGALTALDDAGMKYSLAVGNHDGGPSNTTNFNSYFPSTRVGDGHMGSDNDNNYGLFSYGGMDFILINIEYGADSTVIAWADDLLTNPPYNTRRAIVVTHDLLTNCTTLSSTGQAIYTALQDRPNLFLMLGGHLDSPECRLDLPRTGMDTVYALRSDYQTRSGGNGWLRLMEFQPAVNQIQVYTYTPFLDQWETDANSQFTLPYAMGGTACAAWQTIATNPGIASGASTTVSWGPLAASSQYQWYVSISDGVYTVNGPIWSFTTGTPTAVTLASFSQGSLTNSVQLDWSTATEVGLLGFNLYRSDELGGVKQKLNLDLIPALTPGDLMGNAYQFTDGTAVSGQTYIYWIELVMQDGNQLSDPLTLLVPYWLRLPMVIR